MRYLSRWFCAVAVIALAGCRQTGGAPGGSTSATSAAEATTAAPAPPANAKAPATAPAPKPAATMATRGATEGAERTLPDGLRIVDIKVGSGAMAEYGSGVAVHYTGWLTDGTKFDSSRDRGTPYQFKLGAQPPMVIPGWEEGIKGMRVGGVRRLTIPPALAYGGRGASGVIPPDATLVFEVALLGVK